MTTEKRWGLLGVTKCRTKTRYFIKAPQEGSALYILHPGTLKAAFDIWSAMAEYDFLKHKVSVSAHGVSEMFQQLSSQSCFRCLK